MEEDSPSDIESKATKSRAGRPKGTKDDPRVQRDRKIVRVIELATKNLDNLTIGKAVDLPESTVRSILKRFEPVFTELANVRDYREGKADILAAGQIAALKSAFSGNKLEKSSFLSTLMGYEILNKSERLDLGKSTENHAHSVFGRVNVAMDREDEWIDGNPSE